VPRPLSIVIPSHNRPDLLRACLAAVVRHAPPGTEVLVVDDASPAGAASDCASQFPGVKALRLPRRRGFCGAVNAGVRAASHPFVELLNDDTEVTAGWAGPALATFADPSVAAVAPLVLRPPSGPGDAPTVDSAGDRYFVGGVAGKRGHGEPLGPRWLLPGPVFGASASSAFYRRDALLAAGGFPEEFGAYFEDVDVSFRLHRAGFRVHYEPASRVWHRVGSSYGPPARALLARQARNEELVFWRNLPAPVLLRSLPLHLVVLAAKALRRWRRGELLPFLWGKLCALARLPQTFRHRLRLSGPAADHDLAAWCLEPRFWGLPAPGR
jgi:GT2 family glycosyltransferase